MSLKPMPSPVTRTLSLRLRLAGLMSTVFLLGMFGLYAAARSYAQEAANKSFDRLLIGSALSIAETLSVSGSTVDIDLPYAALDMLSAAPDDRVFYKVIGPRGEIVTGNSRIPSAPPGRRSERGEPLFFDAVHNGERTRFALIGREIAQPGATGWVWIQVGQTRLARDAMAREILLNALAPILAMTLIALGLAWFGIGGALRPLARIGEDLTGREPSDLHALDAPAPSEVAPLVDALNGFMQRLGASVDTLRAFIAEAAHQIRTPLAALLAQVQVADRGDPEQVRQALDAVERNAIKLTRLINQLLSDATVTHRSENRRFEEFDLVRTARLALQEAVPMSLDVDARLETALIVAPCRGDVLTIGEALKNLIDNALKHGGGQAQGVLMTLWAEGEAYVVAVSDRGPGIPLDDRDRVFERFARGGGSAPGAGLGLAIVRQAVQRHGGAIVLRDRPGGGLVVELRLKAAG